MSESIPIWLLCDPVDHSLSPVFQNVALEEMGLHLVYNVRQVSRPELGAALEEIRNGAAIGANVTLPHKAAAMAMMDRLSPAASRAGAVNTVVCAGGQLEGHNTDVGGLRRALVEAGAKGQPLKRAAVLGAGGAARGAVVALDQLGAEQILVINRSPERAAAMVESMKGDVCGDLRALSLAAFSGPSEQSWRDIGLMLNATSLGVGAAEGSGGYDEAVEAWGRLPWDGLEDLRAVHDLCYSKGVTPFLKVARDAGVRGEDGLSMLLYQGADSLLLWTARRPPEEKMRAALWEAVGRPITDVGWR